MERFELELVNGVPLVKTEGDVLLLSTGWPTTLHRYRRLKFMGRVVNCFSTMAGVTFERVSQQLDCEITGIVGMDILQDYDVEIDFEKGELRMSDLPLAKREDSVSMRQYMGVPIVEALIDGKMCSFYVDCSSSVSYLSNRLFEGGEVMGDKDAFFLESGMHSTPIREKSCVLGGRSTKIQFGVLPMQLERAYSVVGVEGVLGSDFFEQYEVMISGRRSEIGFK